MNFIFYILLIMTIFLVPYPSFSQDKKPSVTVDTDFLLPERLVLCGESMPLNDPWIWERLDRELTISVWDKEQVFLWLKRAGRYFPYLEKKLAQEKMPEDLKYLSIAESSLLFQAKSNQGAVGPWQFMPDTASRNGLRSDKTIDERRDLEQSTEAAISYLKRLKEMFGTWSLAMAAYNCGENRIKKEIKEQQENDYYNLKLPDETERYIFRIAAIKLIMENPESFGYKVPEEKIYKPLKYDTVNVDIKKNIHITDFAKAIGTFYKRIRDLNPQIIGDFLPRGVYNLNTPSGTGPKINEVIQSLSSKSPSTSDNSSSKYYIVQEGDTLSGISRKTGVPLAKLKKINNLEGSIIKEGDVLELE